MLLGLLPYTLGVVPSHCVLRHLCFDHGTGTGAYTIGEVPSQCFLRHVCFDHGSGTNAPYTRSRAEVNVSPGISVLMLVMGRVPIL